MTAYWLAGNDAVLKFIVDLLVEEDEAEHGAAHAPLVGAVLKQDHFKQGGQGLRQQLRALPQVFTNGLHQDQAFRQTAVARGKHRGKDRQTAVASTTCEATGSRT